MAEACRETTWRQLSWTADWRVREECYAQALAGQEMRPREYLTPEEVEKLMVAASRAGRYGRRDATLILVA
jgi:hypothetical protein